MDLNKVKQNGLIYPVLYLLSLFYNILMKIRNLCYDKKIFKSKTFNVPIISIGNITTGGTGKTPFTIYLVKHLIKDYQNIAVVSRGYGRKSKGVHVVSDGKGNLLPVELAGDEPVLIARKIPQIEVIVSEDRRKGIQLAIERFKAELIVLDDAFQHRKVNRNCDIVLINSKKNLFDEKILPAGNLRESLNQLKRANVVIFTKIDYDINNDDLKLVRENYKGSVFESSIILNALTDNLLQMKGKLKTINNQSVVAFSGIASPDSFKDTLLKSGINVVDFIPFKDHQWFSEGNLERIKISAQKHNCKVLVTTEKDMVKLKQDWLKDYKLFSVGLEIRVKEHHELIKKVKHCIDSNTKIG